MKQLIAFLLYGLIFTLPLSMQAASLNGFNLSNASVPIEQIMSGGPGKDGIPAILHPHFVSAKQASFMAASDPILGIEIKGKYRAYPIKILNWHEVVNDHIDGKRFIVSYCPLCGSGMAFSSTVNNRHLTFGVSGLLYNSDVLLYDHQTESLWSQIKGAAVSGQFKGEILTQYPLTLTRWGKWQQQHPHTDVLSTHTGYQRNYQHDPYAGYSRTPRLYFPVANQAPSIYSSKDTVMGYKGQNGVIAFPFAELRKQGKSQFTYRFEQQNLTIYWDDKIQSAHITNHQGQELPSTLLYWFAWYAFYPDTHIYKAR
ncbi:DUF3179 domain-containing protein [Photobacterium lutimaris]|uniref:DUF3179 domain-containing protein n=1 Tax=Photobacterium lutimaris TaxID=388278 RepID=A0A2T3J3D1_9GAMM|nr:DUF3179 domain-containing protein [Photobacterium lutimaris]PSU35801.1 hypothetical protein C9I99_01930 [Photobacterium lutimaris]TDR78872.1 uncharacterized protein DUF3179 [Photobacterium lutimaris]